MYISHRVFTLKRKMKKGLSIKPTHEDDIIMHIIFCFDRPIGTVFASGPRNRHSVPGRLIPKTQKMVLDAYLLNTQPYQG